MPEKLDREALDELLRLEREAERIAPGLWEIGGPYPAVSVIYCIDGGCGWPDPEPPAYELVCRLTDNDNDDAKLLAALIAAMRNALVSLIELAREGLDARERAIGEHAEYFRGLNKTLEEMRATTERPDR